ncbi:hypothetical protein BXZ70DRAFT_146963 [Cristinia sonorae]|uniref:Uncharacterized protein n=1 Tax=Cristinia sonorae TaxID=1940300 RepID=A0A8K0UQK3_9AGAR|nr:hypothetical protein BXZ70DRAFT_146963 [Cristinia sonorae]
MSKDQVSANSDIFRKYRNAFLQRNPDVLKPAASDLLRWLGDRRAYYAEARPQIVDLIEVLQATIARHNPSPAAFHISSYIGIDLVRTHLDFYEKLVHIVLRFRDQFIESDLQARVVNLARTILPHRIPEAGTPTSSGPPSTPQSQATSGGAILPHYSANPAVTHRVANTQPYIISPQAISPLQMAPSPGNPHSHPISPQCHVAVRLPPHLCPRLRYQRQ